MKRKIIPLLTLLIVTICKRMFYTRITTTVEYEKGETPESFIQVGWKDNKNRILIKVTQSRTGGNHSSRTLAQFVRFCFLVFSAHGKCLPRERITMTG